MNELKFVFESRRHVLDMTDDLLKRTMKASNGQPTMSPEEVKLAILAIKGTLEHQADVITAMYRYLEDQNKKPSIFRRIFKK